MKRAWQILAVSALVIVSAVVITIIWASQAEAPQEVAMDNNFRLSSPAFAEGDAIPLKYTCKGEDISPPLAVRGVPDHTVSLALIVHDPDAPDGDFVHWTVWNLTPHLRDIPENTVPDGASEGANGFGKSSYGGPCPPSGTHHYVFELYALDTELDLPTSTSRSDLQQAMSDHILAQTKLTGTFSAD